MRCEPASAGEAPRGLEAPSWEANLLRAAQEPLVEHWLARLTKLRSGSTVCWTCAAETEDGWTERELLMMCRLVRPFGESPTRLFDPDNLPDWGAAHKVYSILGAAEAMPPDLRLGAEREVPTTTPWFFLEVQDHHCVMVEPGKTEIHAAPFDADRAIVRQLLDDDGGVIDKVPDLCGLVTYKSMASSLALLFRTLWGRCDYEVSVQSFCTRREENRVLRALGARRSDGDAGLSDDWDWPPPGRGCPWN